MRRMRASCAPRSTADTPAVRSASLAADSRSSRGPLADNDVVIVEAVRSPLGRRNGGLATVHPADLLGDGAARGRSSARASTRRWSARSIGGCVSQVGEQTFNIARTAWLERGPAARGRRRPPSTRSAGRRSRPPTSPRRWSKAGVVDVALACGVESMSRVPLGAAVRGDFGRPTTEVVPRALRADVAVRGRGAHRRQVGHHPRRHRPVRARVAGARAAGVGRGPLRARGRPDRRARRRRGRQADRHDAPRRARRRPARDVARGARQAQAGRARERRAHRRHVVADHRRRRGGAADDRGAGRGARAEGRGRASSTSASSASTRC